MKALTDREFEILKYIAEGYSNKRIGLVLNTTEQTIKNYVRHICLKLDANDRTHAVVLAIRKGILSIGGGDA